MYKEIMSLINVEKENMKGVKELLEKRILFLTNHQKIKKIDVDIFYELEKNSEMIHALKQLYFSDKERFLKTLEGAEPLPSEGISVVLAFALHLAFKNEENVLDDISSAAAKGIFKR